MSDFHSELPNLMDRSVKALFRECPTAVMRLAGIEVADKALRVEDPNLNLLELRADHVFVIEEDQDATSASAIYLEYQLEPDADLLTSWAAKWGGLLRQLRMPVVLLALYLQRGDRATFPDRLVVRVGSVDTELRFTAIRLWEHAERIRSGELPELAPLLVLCEDTPTEATVRRVLPQYRKNIEVIRNLLVTSSTGQKIPLSALATVEVRQGLAEIGRVDARRRVAVLADVQGRSVGSIVEDAKKAIARDVLLPAGYTITWGGAVEELEHALTTLYWAVPISLLLIFILVYACFNSLRDSLVVLTTIPLAVIGGTVLLLLLGLPISVPAIIGYIANFGAEVRNGTIMVSFINRWRNKGLSVREAAVRGAVERLRPEILSALIGVLALIPFLATSGVGATVERPLAAVVIGGIALSRPLAWFLLPTLYVWFDRSEKRSSEPADVDLQT